MEFTSLFSRFAISPLPVPANWCALPLRLILGFGFVEHGYAKLSRGADGFIAILHAIGMAAAPMIVVLLVAIFSVHLPNGFSSIKLISYDAAGAHFGQPGYETDLLYIAGLLALCIGGPGPLSVDRYLKTRRGPDLAEPTGGQNDRALRTRSKRSGLPRPGRH
jgi:putative oxidoreductase